MGQPSPVQTSGLISPGESAALVIEDEAIVATDIELTLKDLGYNAVGLARTHDEALALGIQQKPSIIIADIVLSDGTSGLTAVDELLKTIDACVIFVTGSPEFANAIDREPCLVVTKPFCPDCLEKAVAEAAECRHRHECIQQTKMAVSKLAHDKGRFGSVLG